MKTNLLTAAIFASLLSLGSAHGADYQSVSIKAPVSIGSIGIQNLAVTISYAPSTSDKELYQQQTFKDFMEVVGVEIQGAAMHEILNHSYLSLDELGSLSQAIKTKIDQMLDARIEATFPNKNLEFFVAISQLEFYTTDRSTLSIKHEAP